MIDRFSKYELPDEEEDFFGGAYNYATTAQRNKVSEITDICLRPASTSGDVIQRIESAVEMDVHEVNIEELSKLFVRNGFARRVLKDLIHDDSVTTQPHEFNGVYDVYALVKNKMMIRMPTFNESGRYVPTTPTYDVAGLELSIELKKAIENMPNNDETPHRTDEDSNTYTIPLATLRPGDIEWLPDLTVLSIDQWDEITPYLSVDI